MKKVFVLLLMVLMVASIAFANGDGESKKIELAATTGGMSADSPAGKGMALFAQKVAEYSNGTIEIKVFYDTTLGNATSAINGMVQGSVDLLVCGDSYYSSLVPEIQGFELPYMFSSYAEARETLAGKAGDYIDSKLQAKGIKALSFWEIGFRQLTNNKREVNSPADLKGIKLRTLGAPAQVKAWEAAGAIVTPMDVSELYSAIQQGVVDGQENPLSEIKAQRFYEVQKYMSLTAHVYTPMLFSCSTIAWDRLTSEQKEIILKAAKDAQAEVYKINDANEAALLEEIKASGVKVNENPDREAFKAAMAPAAYEQFRAQNGNDMLAMLGK